MSIDVPRMHPSSAETARIIAGFREGDRDSWHRFVLAYSNLIYHVIHRYLHHWDLDERKRIYVEILESLYRRKLREYDGSARMTTWLTCVVRNHCLDFIRSQRGRRAVPPWLRQLSPDHEAVFRLYYVEGLSASIICERLSAGGPPFTMNRLADCLQDIETRIDPRTRRRVAYDLYAQSLGLTSGCFLDYLQHAKAELKAKQQASRPDYDFFQQETERFLDQIRHSIGKLPDLDRKVIELRFFSGLSADRVAEKLNLSGRRKAYTLQERALRRLRSLVRSLRRDRNGDPP